MDILDPEELRTAATAGLPDDRAASPQARPVETMDERAATAIEDFDWELSAIHEAAHAVIGLDLGFQILEVSIVENDAASTADYAGFRPKFMEGKPGTKALRTLEAYGQFCLAGPTAELWGDRNAFKLEDYVWPDKAWPDRTWPDRTWPDRTWPDRTWPDTGSPDTGRPETGRAGERWVMSSAAQDVTEVMRIATKIHIPGWFDGVARKTRERVEQHWRAIETVADALLRQGTLTEAELIAFVVGGTGKRRSPL